MKKLILIAAAALSGYCTQAQYTFTDVINIDRTEIKNQARTGTCWSFSTTSFLESEAIRLGHEGVDFSEMHNVLRVYQDKAENYVSRQGKANFSQGSLAHDVLRTVASHGIVPESEFSGLANGESSYNHTELEKALKGFLDGVIAGRKPSKHWRAAFNAILETYMGGSAPKEFVYQGKKYTPKSFALAMGIDPKNYVSFTSYTHAPFNTSFILNIPDNYSNQSFYNVPLANFMDIVNRALKNGFTIEWDGDVSEKGFGRKEGIAILPEAGEENIFDSPVKEVMVTQTNRQSTFEDYSTTDDHLMHVVGTAKDQNGTLYYIIKNSWGVQGAHDGYLYMSEAYFKMKTVSVTVHKDALTKELKNQL